MYTHTGGTAGRLERKAAVSRPVFLLIVLGCSCLLYIILACCTRPRYITPGIVPALDDARVESMLEEPDVEKLTLAMDKLRPLHTRLAAPEPGEWLYHHPEPGQTFREYLAIDPCTSRGARDTIYVQPLGDFTPTQREIITLTADYMQLFFNVPVKILENLPLDIIPVEARRVHPSWGDRQVYAPYVLDRVLKPRLPEDAVAYIAFTTSDLYPDPTWNFVFGLASLREHVGVWSIYRFGNPAESGEEFKRVLLRTMKLGTHETGHMFSMMHCKAYECNMCGSNSLPESDRRPPWLCPECMAKVCWSTGTDPVKRFRALGDFCKKVGLAREQQFYEKCIDALGGE